MGKKRKKTGNSKSLICKFTDQEWGNSHRSRLKKMMMVRVQNLALMKVGNQVPVKKLADLSGHLETRVLRKRKGKTEKNTMMIIIMMMKNHIAQRNCLRKRRKRREKI